LINARPDVVFLVGEEMSMLAERIGKTVPVTCAPAAADILEPLLKSLDYGDLIMVKASKSVRLASVATRIRDRFSAA